VFELHGNGDSCRKKRKNALSISASQQIRAHRQEALISVIGRTPKSAKRGGGGGTNHKKDENIGAIASRGGIGSNHGQENLKRPTDRFRDRSGKCLEEAVGKSTTKKE